MNKLLLPLLLVISSALCAQTPYPNFQKRSSPTTLTVDSGATKAYKGLVNGRYADTTAANTEGHIGFYPGATIVCGDTVWMRNSSATKWINQGPSGSLVSTVTIVDSNHIQICNINSCDTITVTNVQGDITNITILSDTTIQVCGSDVAGTEQLTNGTFSGGATGWTLGVLWAYDVNNIVHSFGSTASSFQGGLLTAGVTYTVSVDVGGTAGTVAIALDGGTSQTYSGGAGTSTFTGTWTQAQGLKINLIPSSDFDGSITNVSVKPILPNCDTLQVASTNFLDSVRIYVITPLHAANDSTFYITQAGPSYRNGVYGDSGYLSTAAYDTFLNKVDSLTHSAANNSDILQFIKNGVVTNWDTLDIVCYGLTNPGDVIWSGTGLLYDVTSANYRIDCKPYISPPTQITLTAADATNPRIDVVYVDSSGNAGLLTGTAAATPVTPQIDPSYQVYLTSILVPAVATIAPIDTAVIYDENDAAPTNWTPITNGGTTTNAANTLNVWRGSLSLDVTNINNGDLINFPRGASIDLSAYQSVVGFIKLKAILPVAANIRILWFNGSTQIGSIVNLLLNKSNITTYQAFSVPLTNFGFTQTVVDRFQISYTSNNATVNLGFYADFIYLQNGVAPSPVSGTIVGYNYLTHVKNNNIDSIRLGGIGTQTLTTLDGRNGDYQIQVLGDAGNTQPLFYATGGAQGLSGTGTSVGVTGISPLVPLWGINTATSTSTVGPALVLNRLPSGSGAAGLGASIQVNLPDASGSTEQAGLTQIKWTTATNLSETSAFEILLRNAGASAAVKASLSGPGQWTWAGYGAGTFTGTPAYYIAADASGNLIETAASSVAVSAGNGLTDSVGRIILGGTLYKNTTISSAGFSLTLNDAVGSGSTFAINTPTGGHTALIVTATGSSTGGVFLTATGTAVTAQASSSGTGITASTSTGFGANIAAVDGVPILVTNFSNSTNTVSKLVHLSAETLGTPGNGIGGSIDFYDETSTTVSNIANRLISKLTDVTNATRTSQFIISGVNSAVTGDIISFEGNKRTMLYGRFEPQQGVDVASAAGAIAVGLDGNVFELTGTNAVTLISNLNWVNGSEITLMFTSTATLTNGTATSGTDITILLAGASNFVGSANDVIKLVLGEIGGTQAWREVSRSVN